MTKQYHHEVKLVKISEIRPNKYNPNVVPDNVMDQLVKRIKEEGFLQPVLLRNIPQEGDYKYEIIDGEHRYDAAIKADYDEIPAIILDKTLPEAMLSTINMNKLRGEFDTLKLAEVIHQLHETYSIEEIEEKLGFTSEEQTGMENLLSYDFDKLDNEGVSLDEEEDEGEDQEFKVMLTSKQMKLVTDTLELTGKSDNVDSLITVCLEYLAKHGKKESKEQNN
jgi:ParB/RepB/Spo0J family partition protein